MVDRAASPSPNARGATPAQSTQPSQKQIAGAPQQSGISPIDSGQSTREVDRTVSQKPFASVTRSLTEKDIMAQLFAIKRTPDSDGKQLLSTMIQHGIPATAEAFDQIQNLIKGKKRNADMRAAVVSYAKGLGSSKGGVEILSQYFANQTNVGDNLKKMKASLKQFQGNLLAKKNLFEPSLLGGLMSVLSELDESLKKITKKQTAELSEKSIQRGRLIHEYKLIGDFLNGIESKINKGSEKEKKQLNHDFKLFKDALSGMSKALTVQSILSRDMMSQSDLDPSYYYYQIPNPLAQQDQSIDILVQKDKHSEKSSINIANTKIILRFETPDLGQVCVVIDLKENKVSYQFQTDNGNTKQLVAEMTSDLRDRMKELNYELVAVQTVQKKIDIKQLLIPVLNLDKMTRIITEA